jgi:anti-sigma factor RsiW
MRAEPTCWDLIEFLDDYGSGQLPAGQRQAFDAHLAECPSCDRYTKGYLETVRLARASEGHGKRTLLDAPEELIRAVLSSRGRSS